MIIDNLLNNNLAPVTLWENPKPNDVFDAQEVELSETLDKFSSYEIIYKVYASLGSVISTGQIPVEYSAYLNVAYNVGIYRTTNVSNTKINFNGAYYFATYAASGGTQNNGYAIPVKVIGHR